ncbi:hypothetical protein DCAR_0101785 [Daucus carota subsp. sativus]|uniref:Uncharacterized protein n=1 Tax=Daucus carota subsp. sativus TaxID=79200 RepID=A0AAF1AFW0_DAUCS|nr:PREDICTED: uncharacterized protein LOC108205515 isoform X1 [Daucus carota subsp. sativus]XP_017230995.1 PREDICTED: uncharacterized protein LOC108205515 isoform X1 [Daucus carota subsp. sativus]WOG82619.1 hypothetical protein DCAR_0101785 [Daucus carota subsp. sativus]
MNRIASTSNKGTPFHLPASTITPLIKAQTPEGNSPVSDITILVLGLEQMGVRCPARYAEKSVPGVKNLMTSFNSFGEDRSLGHKETGRTQDCQWSQVLRHHVTKRICEQKDKLTNVPGIFVTPCSVTFDTDDVAGPVQEADNIQKMMKLIAKRRCQVIWILVRPPKSVQNVRL